MISELLTFLALSAVVICTPGADTALTVRNAIVGGRTGGAWTAAGVATGQLVWTVAASFGAAGVLSTSSPAFLTLKIIGVLYLLYLGVQSLRSAWWACKTATDLCTRARLERATAYRQGLLNNLANPKMAAFFISLLPQFVPAASGHLTALVALLFLGVTFCFLTFGWLLAYSIVIAKSRRLLDLPRARRILDAIAGCAMIGFGIRLAFADQVR